MPEARGEKRSAREPKTSGERGAGRRRPPSDEAPQREFPARPEVEYEKSTITIPLSIHGDPAGTQERIEEMKFTAYMRLVRSAPVRNSIGIRQFEFYIDAWELTDVHSKALDANITFTLSKTVQPKSICVALQKDKDYPAMIVYSAIYDVYFNKERMIANQAGVAFATGVRQIPPRNVTVAFQKPFESPAFSFNAGWCWGMQSITEQEFERGAALARSFRE